MRLSEDEEWVLCDDCEELAIWYIAPTISGNKYGHSYSLHSCNEHLSIIIPKETHRSARIQYLDWQDKGVNK